METNTTPIFSQAKELTRMSPDELLQVLGRECERLSLVIDDTSEGVEIVQSSSTASRRFNYKVTWGEYGLNFTNADESGEHGVQVLAGNGYDEWNTNTYKKNMRNAIRMLQSSADVFNGTECAGCENCEWL